MRRVNIVFVWVVAILTCLSTSGFAQNQNNSQQYNPERILQFLDRNKDEKISKQEAERAKRLSDNFKYLDTNNDGFLTLEELKKSTSSSRYTYLESDGIYMYYETRDKELYRNLLPEEFEMPDSLLVFTFISDFYKMDEQTQPYKEASIFLLGRYKGKEVWHCIYMPVTSEESMKFGIMRLGLPKTLGEIEFLRTDTTYSATLTDENKNMMSLSVHTKQYSLSKKTEEVLNRLSLIPKVNLYHGEVIEMNKNGSGNMSGNRSIFETAEAFPNRLTIKGGVGEVVFNVSSTQKESNTASPLDLKPTKIIGAYYMNNKIPFKLGRK